ncbi:arsenic resistance protein [Methylonatrum kenyense]|uniref:arsenic resistance protein n=1 Tax=Methylonatrum kenyense TaxID=455253 RepID=UPI0020BE4090|nr:arsenic resistance protein [Methylonatrum kenyense]MCK8515024.1 arsenic resistance protein [Methylonatrum kenyense]
MHAQLERHQVWIYLLAVLAGLGFGAGSPDAAALLDVSVWPLLALLLFATFTQIPLVRLRGAACDTRFITALCLGNFLILPLLVGSVLLILPLEPAVRLGILLVLLVPCTDWFISFTHLGRGDAARAVAVTPLILLLQLAALPFYLWLFLGDVVVDPVVVRPLLTALVLLIGLPLLLAVLLQRRIAGGGSGQVLLSTLALFPVPLLALVVFSIAASQSPAVLGMLGTLWLPALLFAAFAVAGVFLGKLLARAFRLPAEPGRTLAFSFATRNSFVVLPLALALPAGWEAAALVIVLQSLVELLAMSLFVRWVPRRLIRSAGTARRSHGP